MQHITYQAFDRTPDIFVRFLLRCHGCTPIFPNVKQVQLHFDGTFDSTPIALLASQQVRKLALVFTHDPTPGNPCFSSLDLSSFSGLNELDLSWGPFQLLWHEYDALYTSVLSIAHLKRLRFNGPTYCQSSTFSFHDFRWLISSLSRLEHLTLPNIGPCDGSEWKDQYHRIHRIREIRSDHLDSPGLIDHNHSPIVVDLDPAK